MKGIIYGNICLFLCFSLACNSHKKAHAIMANSTNCSQCKSLLNEGFYVDYPLRVIDKNKDGDRIPLVSQIDSAYKDTSHVITEFEMQRVQDNMFCLLGIKEALIDQYFHPKFKRNECPTGSTEGKIMFYYFDFGNYVKKNSSSYEPINKKAADANTEFWLIGSSNFRFEYTKINGEFVYTGTMQDLINLQNCLEKEKK